jgi:hypothetical protein
MNLSCTFLFAVQETDGTWRDLGGQHKLPGGEEKIQACLEAEAWARAHEWGYIDVRDIRIIEVAPQDKRETLVYEWEVSAGVDGLNNRLVIKGMCRVEAGLEPAEVAAIVERDARQQVAAQGFNSIEDFYIAEVFDGAEFVEYDD